MKAYIDYLDNQLEQLQREVARLAIAREVILELEQHVKAPRQERLSAPPLRKRRHRSAHGTTTKVFEALKQFGRPVKPIEILRYFEIGPQGNESGKKGVYNSLARMLSDGAVVRDDKGFYHLPYPEQYEQEQKPAAA